MPGRRYEEYCLLGSDDRPTGDSATLDEYRQPKSPSIPSRLLDEDIWKVLVISFIATVSLVAGLVIGLKLQQTGNVNTTLSYPKLEYSQTNTLWWNTEYSAENAETVALNQLWDGTIPWESGIIALPNDESEALNLPDSQPFPWDSNSLRVETMCAADDTLRYVPLNSVHRFRPGDGQQRKCRDWSKLQEFAEAHSPCYRYLQPGNTTFSNLERFKFCPEDSEYLPKIRKYFGYGTDWSPEAPEGPRELEW
ncbi:hypothetical protein F4814DRAFT_453363 [Daldinia grandis]|nr:hypothetical protein F4814DRAFT_453363 [Daldinia grandis]